MTKYKIALYIRLSLEDSKYDSLSIENQRMILNEYALSRESRIYSAILYFVMTVLLNAKLNMNDLLRRYLNPLHQSVNQILGQFRGLLQCGGILG